jgi:hypothetical protein
MHRVLGLLATIGYQGVICACAGSNAEEANRPDVRVVHDDALVIVTRTEDEPLQPASGRAPDSAQPLVGSTDSAEGCVRDPVEVAEAQVDGSVALDLTTTGDGVSRLRAAMRDLAAAHNARFFDGIGNAPEPANNADKATALTRVRSTAAAADIPGGVRLVYKPTRASDLAKLLHELRSQIESLRERASSPRNCPADVDMGPTT